MKNGVVKDNKEIDTENYFFLFPGIVFCLVSGIFGVAIFRLAGWNTYLGLLSGMVLAISLIMILCYLFEQLREIIKSLIEAKKDEPTEDG